MNRLATPSIVASMLLAASVLALVSCSTRPPATSPLSPMWGQLHYPTSSGTWVTQPQLDANLLRILPVQGRAVRVDIQANLGTFGVTLRELNGTLTPLTQLPSGGVPAPGAGFFEVAAVNVNAQPPIQTLVVRAPAAIADPANYDVMIVARSSTGGVPDSAPLIIPLRAVPNFTVTVTLNGSGRVTSDLPGISCGTSQNICTAEFTAPVTLAAQSATSGTMITFRSWEGSCTPSGQRCTAVSSGGRTAAMPSFGGALGEQGVKDVAHYVMSLSGLTSDSIRRARGEGLFKANCMACHGAEGKGNPLLGAPNLTDATWLHGSAESAIVDVVTRGRTNQMPAHKGLLDESKIHLLTAYVLSLSRQGAP